MNKGTSVVFAIAMKVQRAFSKPEGWVVNTSVTGDHAFVTLQFVAPEHSEPTDAREVAQCMAVLNQVAAGE